MPSTVTVDGVQFTRFVQSAFKIKGGGLTIYVDPHRIGAAEVGQERADLILITHPHSDHLDPSAIDACRKADTVIVANKPAAEKIKGRPNVVALREGDSTTQKGVSIETVPGYNSYHKREEGVNVGYLFTVAGKTIYHAGDTGKVPEMASLEKKVVDVALVPIGGTYTMDEAEAADAVSKMIKPRHVIPMHYGYATGGDPQRFQSLVGQAAQVHILEPVLKVKYGS